jgi:hypothetical protein
MFAVDHAATARPATARRGGGARHCVAPLLVIMLVAAQIVANRRHAHVEGLLARRPKYHSRRFAFVIGGEGRR